MLALWTYSTFGVFTVPEHCMWSLDAVFIPQRCAKSSCKPANRKNILEELETNYGQAVGYAHKWGLWPLREWPTKHPRIVDIGAGLAMYHSNMHRFFENQSHHFIVDRSANISTRGGAYTTHGGFHKSQLEGGSFPFYSSLECAADINRANGFPYWNRFHTVHAKKGAVAALGNSSVDLVMSVLSWGFHYPISTYAKEVASVLKPVTGRLIIQGLKDQAAMERYFTCDVPKSRFCCVGCRDPSLSPVHPDNAAAPASAPTSSFSPTATQ